MAQVTAKLQSIGDFLGARLSQRIAYWVFLSIVVIEAVILVPSVMRRERELLNHLRSLSSAQLLGRLDGAMAAELPHDQLLEHLLGVPVSGVILGGAIYDLTTGTWVGSFGEPPQLDSGNDQPRYYRRQRRYDAPWAIAPLGDRYRLVVRHDATAVGREFFAFIGRIAGLVVIISVFVTGATLVVLGRLVINPVMLLRRDLLTAGQAVGQDADAQALAFASLEHARPDELGDVIQAFGQMFQQITTAVAVCQQSENRFRTLVEQAVDAFLVLDSEGHIVDVNQTACDSLGYGRDELQQLSLGDIQTTEPPMDFADLWRQLQPGLPQTQSGWHRRRDGSRFPVEVRLGWLDPASDGRGQPGQRQILAIARDVSDRLAAAAAQARLAELGELAATIVHEVRNPLTTILLGLSSFQALDLPPGARARLALALEESDRLKTLLNEILMYSREPNLTLTPVDLTDLVREVSLGLVEQQSQPSSLRFVPPDHPVVVWGDRNKLKQVFINLITNAQEAAGPAGPVVCQIEHSPTQQAVVTVRNGGDPIPPELLPQLTRPFFTTKPSGNGLGLAISERIIAAHRGYLTIESSATDGTCVTVALALASGARFSQGMNRWRPT